MRWWIALVVVLVVAVTAAAVAIARSTFRDPDPCEDGCASTHLQARASRAVTETVGYHLRVSGRRAVRRKGVALMATVAVVALAPIPYEGQRDVYARKVVCTEAWRGWAPSASVVFAGGADRRPPVQYQEDRQGWNCIGRFAE